MIPSTSNISFQERLVQLKKKIEGNMPPRFLRIMHGSTQDLIRSGIERNILQTGQPIPEFELTNEDLSRVRVKNLTIQGPLIITFYRGFWCSYCNEDLANLNRYLPEINKLGAKLVGISPELPHYSKKIIAMQKLDFQILNDRDNQVAEKFGVKYKMDKDISELYKNSFNINLKLYHGNDDWTLPIPARFLVDSKGIIRYSEGSADYTLRPDPDDLMEVLKSL